MNRFATETISPAAQTVYQVRDDRERAIGTFERETTALHYATRTNAAAYVVEVSIEGRPQVVWASPEQNHNDSCECGGAFGACRCLCCYA